MSKPVILRKQRIVMFPCSEHERYVKRQVEYLPSGQVVDKYGPDLATGLGSYIPALIELVDKGTLGFARARISGVTWILCRQYDQNPWQAVCCIAKSGMSACGEPVKEEKPEIKVKEPRMSAKLRRELTKEQVRKIMSKGPPIMSAHAAQAMAAVSQPPRR